MIRATLCTTNGKDPWGANVYFEIKRNKLVAILKTKYSHFQNIKSIPRAIIVYQNDNEEVIMKAQARFDDSNEISEKIKTIFEIEWLRIIKLNETIETTDLGTILNVLSGL